MGFATNFECSLREKFWDIGKVFTCWATDVVVTQRGVIMYPRSMENIDLVKGLVFEDEVIHYMPKFYETLAQRLEVIFIFDSKLKIITKNDLMQFPRLRELSLPNNQLEVLGENLFDFNLELEFISFDDNNLKFIEANLLNSLTKLRKAEFDSAGCINSDADSPEKLRQLKEELEIKCKDEHAKQNFQKKIDELDKQRINAKFGKGKLRNSDDATAWTDLN
jgi:hypothetical protein